MKFPRCVTCHPALVKVPPDTSPTEVRFVRESKTVAPFVGFGGALGGGAVPPGPAGGGGDGVEDVTPGAPMITPSVVAWLEVPVSGVEGTSSVHAATNTVATNIAKRQLVLSITVFKLDSTFPARSTVFVGRADYLDP